MAKTIFNSTEKSNFILNMTEDQYGKLASFGLIAACFTTSLFTIVPILSDKASYSISTIGLAVSGVLCMILAMIALIKKYVSRRIILPVAAFGAMLLWSVVSLIFSYDYNVGFYGFPQRGEGILALIFYFCFFITAASIKRKKAVSTFFTAITAVGLLNSLWALIQIFTGELDFPVYAWLSTINIDTVAPSGLAQSPIFLAMLLSLSMTAAAADAVLTDNKAKRIFDIICLCLYSFVLIFTHCIMGIFGLVFGVVTVFAAAVKGKTPKLRMLSVLAIVLSALTAFVIGINFKPDKNGKFGLYDGYILWSADSWQRIDASGNYNSNHVDIDSPLDVYSHLNNKTIDIIKEYPLTGTGPEQLVYPQLYTTGGHPDDASVTDIIPSNPGTFDKVYNEYLYTAATRGIPSAIALLTLIISVLFIIRRKLKDNADSHTFITGMLVICGAIIFLIGCSNITFSPVFWACAGAACAELSEVSETKKRK